MQDVCSQSGLQTDLHCKNLLNFDLFWLFQFGYFDCLNLFKSILEFAGDASSCEGVSIGILQSIQADFTTGWSYVQLFLDLMDIQDLGGKEKVFQGSNDDILDDF